MRAIILASTCLLAACGFGNDVGQAGGYAIVPSTRVTDSAPYPLRSFLVVEHDLRVGQARVYVFTGNLRAADVGLEDLRRITRRANNFAMAFELPQRRVAVSIATVDAGIVDAGIVDAGDDADAGPITSHGETLAATVGDEPLTLIRLDDQGLFRSGASRYLTALRTSEYSATAFFGVFDASEVLPLLSIERLGISAGGLTSAEPTLVRTDTVFGFSYVTRADYLIFELAQVQRRKKDGSQVDGLVRTLIEPGAPYGLSPALLTNVTGQGCWSRERPLEARVHQIARSYQPRTSSMGGDWAAIYERVEVVTIPTEEWTAPLSEPPRSAYCDDFE